MWKVTVYDRKTGRPQYSFSNDLERAKKCAEECRSYARDGRRYKKKVIITEEPDN